MFENSRTRLSHELTTLIDRLESDLLERQEWIATSHSRTSQRPTFTRKYTSKQHYSFRSRDEKSDIRLHSLEFKEGLNRETRLMISEISQSYNDRISEEVAKVTSTLNRQFKENPYFSNLSPKDVELILEGHRKECSSIERRNRAKMGMELEVARCKKLRETSSTSRSSTARQDRETRDRIDLALSIAVMREENKMRLVFEEYVSSKLNDCTITIDQVDELRKENELEVRKVTQRKTDAFAAERERDDRMRRAKWLEYYCPVDPETHSKLLDSYRMGMANVEVSPLPQIEWDRALLDLDGLFVQSGSNWEQFSEAAVLYWSCLALPKRRKKYDRIVSRYATMYLSEEELDMNTDRESVSVLFSQRISELRSRRDELLCKILRLDVQIASELRTSGGSPALITKDKRALPVDYSIAKPSDKNMVVPVRRREAFDLLWDNT